MTQNELHDIVWSRFIRKPYGHLLDYADRQGNTSIPTAEECRQSNPNPYGWWTPIENGGFFGGLYLEALLTEYARCPSDRLADEIDTLVSGLERLQDVARKEGFIARGVAQDGVSHYPVSSEDQVFPWVMGMYSYLKSPLCRDRADVRARLLRLLRAVWSRGGAVPCDGDYDCANDAAIDAPDWRRCANVLFSAYVLADLSGDEADWRRYEALCGGRPGQSGYTRCEIVSHGFAHDMVRNTGLIQMWICVSFHLAMHKLAALDQKRGALYAAGCRMNGVTALQFAPDIEKYDNRAGGFDLNWRVISPLRRPFEGDLKSAWDNACEECAVWQREAVPHRHMEHTVLGNALWGLWIALISMDSAVEAQARAGLSELDSVDWNTLTISYAFVAESCLIYAQE